jgi:hypothetical protein
MATITRFMQFLNVDRIQIENPYASNLIVEIFCSAYKQFLSAGVSH